MRRLATVFIAVLAVVSIACGDNAVPVDKVPTQRPLWSNGVAGAPWTVNWWK